MSNCSSCGAEIIWKTTKNGKTHPFNAKTTFAAVKGSDGNTHCVFVNISHFATCPNAREHSHQGKSNT
jgi:hypothetical protein